MRSYILNFSLILLAIVSFCKAEDFVLNFGPNGYVQHKSVYNGNGFAFCSWMKFVNSYLEFLHALTLNEDKTVLFSSLTSQKKRMFGSAYEEAERFAYTEAFDDRIANSSTWFHICTNKNESFISFYLNGQPIQQYKTQPKHSAFPKNSNIKTNFGSLSTLTQNGSFSQANIFERSITDKEAMDMYNCEIVEGDLLSWTQIISKSDDLLFLNGCEVVEGNVPCPTPASELPNNAGAGMSNSGDSGPSSGNSDEGSFLGNPDIGSSSGNSNPSSFSGNPDTGSNSGKSNQVPNSDNSDPGSSSRNSNQGSSPGKSSSPM